MVTLTVLIVSTAVALVATAWLVALTARVVGSRHAQFRRGFVGSLIIFAIGLLVSLILLAVTPANLAAKAALTLFAVLAEFVAIFIVLQRVFDLRTGAAFAPFGAYVAVAALQFGIAVFVIRPYLIEAFSRLSNSMLPTLGPDNRICVEKVAGPRRFDLVAYYEPVHGREIYCKRILALPGERIRFEDGGILINDQPVVLPLVIRNRCHAFIRTIGDRHARYHDGETIALGSDEFFVIGDNPEISVDSRLQGPSKMSSLVGVVDLIYWPLSQLRVLR